MMHNAFQAMLDFNKLHDVKEVYRMMQLWHLKNNDDSGVFCNSLAITKFTPRLMMYSNLDDIDYHGYEYLQYLQVFGTWRYTLGIYRIDEDVQADVIKSPIPLDTPMSIFENLPEWCVYFELGMTEAAHEVHGFWALFDGSADKKFLKLIFHTNVDVLAYILLPIRDGYTIDDALNEYHLNATKDPILAKQAKANEQDMARVALSHLLWLCVEAPDISKITGEPLDKASLRQPKHTVNKKTGVFVPPNQPFIYEIGKRLGGEVRTFSERIGSTDRISSRKRPHIRRGHWHGHWRGTGQAKEFFVKWQPAVFVNAGI